MQTSFLSKQLLRISPVAMAMLAIAILCAMDGVLKDLTARYSSLQVTFMRFAPSAMFGAMFFFAWRTPAPSRRSILGNIQRGALFLIASALFIHAIARAPLTQVFAISYIAPLLAALLAMPVLGERPDGRVGLSLALGFVGVLIAMGGVDLSGASLSHVEGAVSAFASSLCYAFVLVYLRRQAMSDPPITIALFQSLVPALVLGLYFVAAEATRSAGQPGLWKPIAAQDVPGLVFVGLCSVVGHMGMAHAFARAEASRLAPVEYSSFVWAALVGLIWFAEIPAVATVLGAALIIAACVMIRR